MKIQLANPGLTLAPIPSFSGKPAENPKKQAIESFVA